MRRLLVVLMAVGLVVVGCGDDNEPKETSGPSGDTPPVSLEGTVNDHGTATAGDSMAMELDDNYFGPTFVRTESDKTVELELHNEGQNAHTFTSTQLGVDEELKPGESKTVKVTAPGVGSAEFHCRFHQSAGMQGALFVG